MFHFCISSWKILLAYKNTTLETSRESGGEEVGLIAELLPVHKIDLSLARVSIETNWQVETWVSGPHCSVRVWGCPLSPGGASELRDAPESQQLHPAGAEGHCIYRASGILPQGMAISPELSPDIHYACKHYTRTMMITVLVFVIIVVLFIVCSYVVPTVWQRPS